LDDERDRCPPRNKTKIRIIITKTRIRMSIENIMIIERLKREGEIGTKIRFK
jgi:hypothetical protein